MNAINSKPTGSVFFQTKSLLRLIKPFLCLARPFGIAPFIIKTDEQGQYVVKISRPAVIYSYVIITLIFGSYKVILGCMYENEILDLPNGVMNIFRTLLSAINYYSLLRNSEKFADIFNTQRLLLIPLPSYYSAFPIAALALMMTNSILNQFIIKPDLTNRILGFFLDCTPPFAMLLLYFPFNCQMSVLHGKITNLNEDLTQCVYLLKTSPSTNLRPIMSHHMFLRKLCIKINQAYGMPMLVTYSAVCYEVTWCFYCIMVADQLPGRMICITWAFLQLTPAFITMALCQRVENDVQKARTISYEMASMTPNLPIKTQDQVREWDLQLKQLPMRFTANGFFDLNGTQIKTIVSVIITYSVILVQNIKTLLP